MKILSSKDFSLATCQATVFTPEAELSTARIVRELLPQWAQRFDADPTLIPPVQQLPREAPRLILVDRNDAWRCEIAPARASVFWQKATIASEQPQLAEFFRDASNMLEAYIGLEPARVGRIACVLNWFARHDSPGVFLARHFCKDEWQSAPLNRPENFELHAHKRFPLEGRYTVNSWVRSKTGSITSQAGSQPVVLVEQDLNTLAEEVGSRNYTAPQVQDFFAAVASEFPSILGLYYPSRIAEV